MLLLLLLMPLPSGSYCREKLLQTGAEAHDDLALTYLNLADCARIPGSRSACRVVRIRHALASLVLGLHMYSI